MELDWLKYFVGFKVLSAYCDLVAKKHGLEVSQDLELKHSLTGKILTANGVVIDSTRRSLVIRLVDHESIVKLLPCEMANVEIDIHKQTDMKSAYLRRLLAVYDPVGFPEFRALELAGFGIPLKQQFEEKLDWERWNRYFDQVSPLFQAQTNFRVGCGGLRRVAQTPSFASRRQTIEHYRDWRCSCLERLRLQREQFWLCAFCRNSKISVQNEPALPSHR